MLNSDNLFFWIVSASAGATLGLAFVSNNPGYLLASVILALLAGFIYVNSWGYYDDGEITSGDTEVDGGNNEVLPGA